MTDTLHLTRADVEAVANWIWIHCRASPNGRGYKVWLRMYDFLNEGNGSDYAPTDAMPLFDVSEEER